MKVVDKCLCLCIVQCHKSAHYITFIYFLMIKFCDICPFAPGPDVISAYSFFVRQEIDFYFPALVNHLSIWLLRFLFLCFFIIWYLINSFSWKLDNSWKCKVFGLPFLCPVWIIFLELFLWKHYKYLKLRILWGQY